MRSLQREIQTVYVSQPLPPSEIMDSDGNGTGNYASVWDEPTQLFLNVKPVTDKFEQQAFGAEVKNILKAECTPYDVSGYDFVENSAVWIGVVPNGVLTDADVSHPMNSNYTIKQILDTDGQITVYFDKISGASKA